MRSTAARPEGFAAGPTDSKVVAARGINAELTRGSESIGYPVVVKPCHGGRGRGVSVRLTGPDRVRAAFRLAFTGEDTVLVETFATGDDHRALILGGRVIAVVRRMPPQVTGDGRRSVAALVDQLNEDPRRSGRQGGFGDRELWRGPHLVIA